MDNLNDPVHIELLNTMKQCIACELHTGRTQVVIGDYGSKNSICFIGEAPGRNEDLQGRPFVGQSGKLLDQMLESIGLSRKNVSVLNICKCRPPNNRNPTSLEQQTCGKWLDKQLAYLEPSLIVTLGSVPLGYFVKGAKISNYKGKLVVNSNYPVYPMFHPAYVLYGGSTRDAYQQDFEEMLRIYEQVQNTDQISKTRKQSDQSSLDEFF